MTPIVDVHCRRPATPADPDGQCGRRPAVPGASWARRAVTAAVAVAATVVGATPAWADSVTVNPTANGLTFGTKIQNLLNWTAQGALWACLASILIGAGTWGLSKHFGNHGGANKGMQLVIGGAVGALIVSTAPAIVNSMFAN